MKTRINLYLPHLRPVKEVLPFTQLITYTVMTLLVMIIAIAGLNFLNNSIKSDTMILKATLQVRESMLADKAAELNILTKQSPLLKEIELVKEKINEKKKVLTTLNREVKVNSGYSNLFSGLADIKMHNVWLTHIATRNDSLNFGGKALNSRDIPRWVNELESSSVLNGQTFSTLSIKREDNIVLFTLHNDPSFVDEGNQ